MSNVNEAVQIAIRNAENTYNSSKRSWLEHAADEAIAAFLVSSGVGEVLQRIVSYDDLLRKFEGSLDQVTIFGGDVEEIDEAYDAMIFCARSAVDLLPALKKQGEGV